MPGGDGTGSPRSTVPRGSRMRDTRPLAGPGGDCVCPKCGSRTSHERGTPCYVLNCPECGAKLVRG